MIKPVREFVQRLCDLSFEPISFAKHLTINMKIEINFENPNAGQLLKHISSRLRSALNDVKVSIDDTGGFYKILFRHRYGEKCPFAIWISIGSGDNLFFNIGDTGDGATVFHHVSIVESIEEVVDFFDTFINNCIWEEKLFCKGKLKKID